MRSGDDLSLTGVAATVPETITPLQLGSSGHFDDQRFELIGRVRWQWMSEGRVGGAWIEWLALFNDGSHGWLAEAMGRFMMTRRIDPLPGDPIVDAVAAGGKVIPGALMELAGIGYRVTDARAATAVGSDGELPFAAPAGEALFSVDLANGSGGCASVQRHGSSVSAYAGTAVKLVDLAPRGLRSLDGWTRPVWAA